MEGALTFGVESLTRADYERMLDPDVLTFVRETEAFEVDPRADIAVRRAAYNAMARHFRVDRPAGLPVRDETIAGVPVRRYGGRDGPLIVYFHGGGFVLGGLDSHDAVCAEIADRMGCRVVSVAYRLAPEHALKTGFEDGLLVVQSLRDHPLVLVGDSAGGTIAAWISGVLMRVSGNLLGQVLIYPAIPRERSGGSWVRQANAPLLTREECKGLALTAGGGLPPVRFADVPPTFVSGAAFDPLHDDGAFYCDAVRAAGGSAAFVSEPGLVHGHLRARHRSKRAAAAFGRIIDAIEGFAAQT